MRTREDDARLARVLRGGLAASSATFVALASHLAGGGSMPALTGVLVPWALSLAVCMAWAGRRLSLPRLSVSVVASQLFFHLLFMLGTPSGGMSAGGPTGAAHSAHPHGAHEQMTMPMTSAPTTELVHAGASMWVWHVLAAVVTVVVLHRGEVLLLRLRELAGRTAAWLLRGWDVVDHVVSFVAPPRPVVLATAFLPLHPVPQLSPLLRRGPPAPHAV